MFALSIRTHIRISYDDDINTNIYWYNTNIYSLYLYVYSGGMHVLFSLSIPLRAHRPTHIYKSRSFLIEISIQKFTRRTKIV